jgi:hypothetical protein
MSGDDLITKVDDNGVVIFYDAYTGEEVSKFDSRLPTAPRIKYTMEYGNMICEYIRQGRTLKDIGKLSHMPDAGTIYRWQSMHPEFKDRVETARVDRAEHFHDLVISTAKELVDKEDVPVAKTKIDAFKWAAEKGNPSKYGSSTKVDIHGGGGTIIVDTGIRRDDNDIVDADFEEVSCNLSNAETVESTLGIEQKGVTHAKENIGGDFEADDTGHGLRAGLPRTDETSSATGALGRDQQKKQTVKKKIELIQGGIRAKSKYRLYTQTTSELAAQ